MILSDEDAGLLAAIFQDAFGWELGPESRLMMQIRLKKRIAELGLASFADYAALLKWGDRRADELRHVADLLTTRETYFFRESYQLAALTDEIFPKLAERVPAGGRVRLWSAGCSSGEEAYTLAILALESRALAGRTVEVFGSDLSTAALAAAQRANYDPHALRETPAPMRAKWFVERDGRWSPVEEVRKLVRFATFNLASDEPAAEPFDVVVCRNVLIYFSANAKRELAKRFHRALRPGGWLLLGHAESFVSVTTDFDLVTLRNDLVYRRPDGARALRVLVVDDSAYARRTLARIVEGLEGAELAGVAPDGVAALREVKKQAPDVLLLDLEMPELDGFAVLRALQGMPDAPSVIVVSAMSEASNVVKALELGAFDFLPKPGKEASPELETLAKDLAPRLAALRAGARARPMPFFEADHTPIPPPRPSRALRAATRVVVVGASTGGPGALLEIVSTLPADLPAAVVIALHMPAGFTLAFAERLARRGRMIASEARTGETLYDGQILVCPGGHHLTLARGAAGQACALKAATNEPWVPSVDRLFESAARLGPDALGVVLTGMGNDGAAGAAMLRDAGGTVIVESPKTAVVNGMPASSSSVASAIVERGDIASWIIRWAGRR